MEGAMDILESGVGELIQPFDLDEFREWNRTKKSRKLEDKLMSEQEAVSRFVYDGCYIGTELYGTVRCPMSLAREVVRQGKKDLRVCGQGVLELDLWLAAGLVKKLDITYIGLEVYGTSSALRRAVESAAGREVRRVVERRHLVADESRGDGRPVPADPLHARHRYVQVQRRERWSRIRSRA
jgi:hypothetical protein